MTNKLTDVTLKTEVLEKLDGVVEIIFEKANGNDQRTFQRATRNLDLIPKKDHPKADSKPHDIYDNNTPVYVLEEEKWKSFNVTGLIKATAL